MGCPCSRGPAALTGPLHAVEHNHQRLSGCMSLEPERLFAVLQEDHDFPSDPNVCGSVRCLVASMLRRQLRGDRGGRGCSYQDALLSEKNVGGLRPGLVCVCVGGG